MAVSREDVLRWLDASQKVFAENRQQLTELDSAVGDGDFGDQSGPRLHCGAGGAVR